MENKINDVLKKYYPIKINYDPIKINYDKIYFLSHFRILFQDWNKHLPFEISLDGFVNKKNKIITVYTYNNIKYSWNEYIKKYTSFLPQYYNPYIDKNNFMILLHTYSNINFLCIKSLDILDEKNNIVNIEVSYINKPLHNLYWNNKNKPNKIKKDNHFYFSSFNIDDNKTELKKELMRLFINRDKYKSIHFHLDNNGGGDIVPAHLIMRCLVGKKESWMKNIKKITKSRKIVIWNCWKEEDINSPNYERVKMLDLDFIPQYETKYNGKIYLYMDKQNGSAAWFFITYLIYSFGKNIKRFTKKLYGKTLKFGTISKNSNLVLKGFSGTTSGDGNAVSIK